jgi:ankyrin repeat protein
MNNDVSVLKLLHAIEKNDTATVSSLIASGVVNVNDQLLPLHRATEHGHVDIMTALLDAGADINAADWNHRTACHVAILNMQFDALKLLVVRGASLNVVCRANISLLKAASLHASNNRIALLLLDAGAPLDHLTHKEMMQLVTSAAVRQRLLARAINVSALRDENGATLCHYVVRNVRDNVDLCCLLSDALSVCGLTVRGETPLHWAACSGNATALRVLLELGTDVDAQDRDGWTALRWAVEWNVDNQCAELLLALGADVSLVDNHGQSVCHAAAAHGKLAALSTFLAAGGVLDRPDNTGETSRMIAVREHSPLPTANEVAEARRRIAQTRLDLVRERALQICVGLQPLNLDALRVCEILVHSFGAIGALIAFHRWWAIATKVKHFSIGN